MAKKARKPKISFDYHFGIGTIIPSTQEAFKGGTVDSYIRKGESEAVSIFKKNVIDSLATSLTEISSTLPVKKDILIFIIQYFNSEKEYKSRDCDNMAKTVLDALKGHIYEDDGQVRTLVVSKKVKDNKVPQNFAFVAIKMLPNDNDTDVLAVCGIEAAVALFAELQKKYLG